mmetsp:Transcript_17606/g.16830  ORF Transcript_17606/g.16830 Transcript_17606/m.16830 type:complete len:242 (-) Transcript_17606:420-1145(-)
MGLISSTSVCILAILVDFCSEFFQVHDGFISDEVLGQSMELVVFYQSLHHLIIGIYEELLLFLLVIKGLFFVEINIAFLHLIDDFIGQLLRYQLVLPSLIVFELRLSNLHLLIHIIFILLKFLFRSFPSLFYLHLLLLWSLVIFIITLVCVSLLLLVLLLKELLDGLEPSLSCHQFRYPQRSILNHYSLEFQLSDRGRELLDLRVGDSKDFQGLQVPNEAVEFNQRVGIHDQLLQVCFHGV